MELIIDYLKRNLKAAGPHKWSEIAATLSKQSPTQQSFGEPLLRKLAYGDRKNPCLKIVQPLLTYFQAIDSAAAKKRAKK